MTTKRLAAYIHTRFPHGTAHEVIRHLTDLGNLSTSQSEERVQTAVVLAAGGTWEGFQSALKLAHIDWRDALVAGGLENEGWEKLLEELLGNHLE